MSKSLNLPTNVNALYFFASSQILSNGATFPSIENTPSVTINLMRAFDDFNFSSKSFLKLERKKLIVLIEIELCAFDEIKKKYI